MFCVSFSALSIVEISHASVPSSLPRVRALVFFFFIPAWFALFRHCPRCLRELSGAISCVPLHSPPFVCSLVVIFFAVFCWYLRSVPCLHHDRVICFVLLCVSLSRTFSQPMIHCSTSLSLYHSSHRSASDTASSSLFPRFQRPGVSSLFFSLTFAYRYVRTRCLVRCVHV